MDIFHALSFSVFACVFTEPESGDLAESMVEVAQKQCVRLACQRHLGCKNEQTAKEGNDFALKVKD